jgi:hypothetical protein
MAWGLQHRSPTREQLGRPARSENSTEKSDLANSRSNAREGRRDRRCYVRKQTPAKVRTSQGP